MCVFFEPTTEPNVEYEIILRYDCRELSVVKVQIVRIEPLAVTDVTKHRTQNPIVEGVVARVRNLPFSSSGISRLLFSTCGPFSSYECPTYSSPALTITEPTIINPLSAGGDPQVIQIIAAVFVAIFRIATGKEHGKRH